MKIAIVAGGTGGHIYPALSLAEELKKRGNNITFFGSKNRMENKIIPEHNFHFIGLYITSTYGGLFKKIKSFISIIKCYKICLKLLKDYDLAIGFGNYISIPVMLAAKKLRIKTIIHEQNSFAGRANLFLDKKMDLVIGSYSENIKQFNNRNIKILGNPQSSKAFGIPKDPTIITNLGLDPTKKIVTVFMGSLGSHSVNKVLIDYFNKLDGRYQIIYASGSEYYEHTIRRVIERPYIKIFKHINGIDVMNNSDLIICRAGATTISEIEAIGIPSILIPSPYVPNNHQYYNAKSLVKNDAAIMIEESKLDSNLLDDTVNDIINNNERLRELGKNAKKLSNPNVLSDIIKEIEKI